MLNKPLHELSVRQMDLFLLHLAHDLPVGPPLPFLTPCQFLRRSAQITWISNQPLFWRLRRRVVLRKTSRCFIPKILAFDFPVWSTCIVEVPWGDLVADQATSTVLSLLDHIEKVEMVYASLSSLDILNAALQFVVVLFQGFCLFCT